MNKTKKALSHADQGVANTCKTPGGVGLIIKSNYYYILGAVVTTILGASVTPRYCLAHLCQLLLDTAARDLPHAPLRLQEVPLALRAKQLLLRRLQSNACRCLRRCGHISRGLGFLQICTRLRQQFLGFFQLSSQSFFCCCVSNRSRRHHRESAFKPQKID